MLQTLFFFLIIAAANISDKMLPSLTCLDLKDLLLGPENLMKRKLIWDAVHLEPEVTFRCYRLAVVENSLFFVFFLC